MGDSGEESSAARFRQGSGTRLRRGIAPTDAPPGDPYDDGGDCLVCRRQGRLRHGGPEIRISVVDEPVAQKAESVTPQPSYHVSPDPEQAEVPRARSYIASHREPFREPDVSIRFHTLRRQPVAGRPALSGSQHATVIKEGCEDPLDHTRRGWAVDPGTNLPDRSFAEESTTDGIRYRMRRPASSRCRDDQAQGENTM